ncbi:sensor histidine kinase [Streptomyces sp. NBC_00825]|uniref:sensor histidine kinase n=1 Tax=unclassified Streptomyces TaxID=2593676 RepID=UPI002255CED0|nr:MULTISPECIES: sensor histidine kinase [unclassified Streptomyces]WTB57274.1 sensor histidine kinase [Streptomyces sp. NBC_00826]WTH89844.1 sensor histidine kinase [Streptomyces sp. NBC_00825]WTH98571.1 sensor histidine kinase [Streptomyces sp. NBC_00822]MCX4863949.1 sensor histidine kinase [Streptomyces sp. NBC_00906]MCX4895187.1 sensor histidine kinase [Streptomyces sp. NBC_00892]
MSAPPPTTRRARRSVWPQRVFSQVLLMQLAIATGVTVLATGLFLAPLSAQLDDQAMRRALAIAQSTAAEPQLTEALLATDPSPTGPVQSAAERVRRATGAEYVVVMDRRGVRWSHTDADEIGKVVSTDPSDALAGRDVMEIDSGTLGRSARGKVPLRDESRHIVGAVSVGIAYDSVRARLLAAIPGLFAYAGGALAVGALAAYLISRRLQRQTHDLAFSDISALLTEREAMLHGIREGVVALDRTGRIRLLNDEAQRLLGLGPDAAGRPLDAVLGAGRTADVLAGRVLGDDLLTVQGARVLLANRMPTDDGGAVATLRDRTELEHLGRELDSTRGLIDALRAQDHEHANRMHTLLGLLELDMHEDAMEYVTEIVGVHRATAEQVTEKVHDPLLAALLVGKATVAAERGAALRLAPGTLLPDRLVDPRGLVTVVGNLVDNALDAAAGADGALVEVGLRAEGRTVVLRVSDNGPGVPPGRRESIFTEGWSTKEVPVHGKRGLGLALVRRLAQRQGGSVGVDEAVDGGAEFTVVLPEALTDTVEMTESNTGIAGEAQ